MAESFSHKWGQIIGNLVQEFIRDILEETANECGCYLDFQKKRQARSTKKVTWEDRYGNFHDLDYVLERGGTESACGLPVAFIETAWRRYTKHSKNKVKEIEGALIPLAETYSHLNPFLGAILAGVFTPSSLSQLESKGFAVLYLQYTNIVAAFFQVGINAGFDERTAEAEFSDKISQWKGLSQLQVQQIKSQLLILEKPRIEQFTKAIIASLSRSVMGIRITVLHGLPESMTSIQQAIEYIQNYATTQLSTAPPLKYEIEIRYNNDDMISGIFRNKAEAMKFLRTFH